MNLRLQVISECSVTMRAQVQSQVCPYGICGEHSGTGTCLRDHRFSPVFILSVFHIHINPYPANVENRVSS